MSRAAGVLISAPILLLASLFLPADPARASEREVVGDMVVAEGDTAKEVSTAWGDVLVEGEVEEYVRSGFGNVEIKGPVSGNVYAGSGDVYVYAPVKGDVKVGQGDVYVKRGGRVEGRVSLRNGSFYRDPGVIVVGGVERADIYTGFDERSSLTVLPGGIGWAAVTLVLAAVAVLAVVAVPGPLRAATRNLETSPGYALALGVGSLPAAVVVSVLLAVTGVGVLLLFLLWPAYLALLLFGALAGSYFLGRKVMFITGRYRAGDALAAAVGVVLVSAASQVPVLGRLFLVVLALFGAGAVFSALLARRKSAPRLTYASYEDYREDRRDG